MIIIFSFKEVFNKKIRNKSLYRTTNTHKQCYTIVLILIGVVARVSKIKVMSNISSNFETYNASVLQFQFAIAAIDFCE
jgi:hypothetical protein